MRYPYDEPVPMPHPPAQRQLLASSVLGMAIFVLTEIMLFAGFISAFIIVKAGAPIWPPPGQPRLPVWETGINSMALLASGVILHLAYQRFKVDAARSRKLLLSSMLLGGFFVVFQGFEWAAMIAQGLTMTSSTHGGFFYLIVGMHALHAVAALMGFVWIYRRLLADTLRLSQLQTLMVFWYFVVAVWPILYWKVYW